MSDADFDRPQVGIGTPLLDGNLCNLHAHQLAGWVREGCEAAGLLGFAFGTPAVSDNISQGHPGGRASLPSRNAIANAAEMVCSAHRYDALVGLHCCDKNGPGFAMALARLNDPGLIVSGGSIGPGHHGGKETTILDVYDCQAKAQQGAMSQSEADAVTRTACPGAGGCGINASFNTWAVACEAMGISVSYSSSNPAIGPEKVAECKAVGETVANLLRGRPAAAGRPDEVGDREWDAEPVRQRGQHQRRVAPARAGRRGGRRLHPAGRAADLRGDAGAGCVRPPRDEDDAGPAQARRHAGVAKTHAERPACSTAPA